MLSREAVSVDARERIVELCRDFYRLGWVSGTGGGMSIKQGDRIFMAPSGVQKERLRPADIFVLDRHGDVVERPADASLKLSACAPLRSFSPWLCRHSWIRLPVTGIFHGCPWLLFWKGTALLQKLD